MVSCKLHCGLQYNLNCDGSVRVKFHTTLNALNTVTETECFNFKCQLVYKLRYTRIVSSDVQSSQRDTCWRATLGDLSTGVQNTIIWWLICSYILYNPGPDKNIIDFTALFNIYNYLSNLSPSPPPSIPIFTSPVHLSIVRSNRPGVQPI